SELDSSGMRRLLVPDRPPPDPGLGYQSGISGGAECPGAGRGPVALTGPFGWPAIAGNSLSRDEVADEVRLHRARVRSARSALHGIVGSSRPHEVLQRPFVDRVTRCQID